MAASVRTEDESMRHRLRTWATGADPPVQLLKRWAALQKAMTSLEAECEKKPAGAQQQQRVEACLEAVRAAELELVKEVDTFEFKVSRVEAHAAAERLDGEKYDELGGELGEEEEGYRAKILENKAVLAGAKAAHTRSMQNELLRQRCEELDARPVTESRIREVEAETRAAAEELRELDALIDRRRKQFALLSYALKDLSDAFADADGAMKKVDVDGEEAEEASMEEG